VLHISLAPWPSLKTLKAVACALALLAAFWTEDTCAACLFACLPACLPALSACLLACLLACVRSCVGGPGSTVLGRAFDQGRAWIDQEADCWLAGYLEDCDMRRTPTPPCNYRPVPLGLLARAAEEQDADLA
jgi:hypothetical protein